MDENELNTGGWNEHSMLVLNELKRLNQRLDLLENQLEQKLDRTLDTFKTDHKELNKKVDRMTIDMAILKTEVYLKSAAIAFAFSGAITIVAAILSGVFG